MKTFALRPLAINPATSKTYGKLKKRLELCYVEINAIHRAIADLFSEPTKKPCKESSSTSRPRNRYQRSRKRD